MKYIRCIGIKFTFLLFLLSGFRLFGQIVHVDPAATGTGDGASWANAVTDLQAGIDLAATVASSSFPIQVWIKSGTYKATTGTDREVSYELKSYVELYGGFDGTETTLAQRTISANPTVLSGDIGTINDAADNSRTTFIYTSSFEGPIIIDGLTLDSYTNISNANGAVGLIFGPEGPIPVVEYLNCVFQNNEITFGSVTGFSEIPHVFQSCTFLNNGVGGAVRNAIRVANIDADITVENSLFVGNREPILRQLGKLRLVNNTFVKNTVNVLYLQEQTTSFNAFVYNNIFWGNPGTDMVVDANAVQDLIADRNIVEDPFTFGTSTISEEPLFQDFTGGDYSLTVCSPALEVGNNSVISGSITEDLAGNPRLSNNTIDLGAFENPNMPLLFSAIEVGPIQCAGESTGSISVNAGGGTGSGVRYSLDGSTAQSSGLFENLSAGTYEVFIEDDGDECLISEIFILEDPIPIQIDFTVNNSPTMNTITVSASGGEAPYTYSLDGTNYVNGDLPLAGTGTYTIYARDLTGCVATKAVYLTSEGRNVIFLDPDATGDESGSSWSDAITDLQAAIEAAAVTASDDFPSEVWAIDGTYYPDVPSSTDRRKTIFMRNNVHLLGGFASGETEASERDPKVRVTTLSGDIGVPGDSTDNSYGMLTVGTDVTNEALIDGWTLQGAFSLAIEPTNGAIHLMGDVGTFHIRNCEFRFNLSNQGACIRTLGVINTTSTVNIETSAFYNNGFLATSNYIGSAIYVKNELSVANSVFFDNRSGLGGVFYIGGQDGQLSSINNTYYQSLAGNSGSVLFDASGGTATVRWYNNINSGELVEPDEALIVQTSIGSVFEGTNNISGGQTLSGVNNLVVDPQFVSTNIRNLDLRLSHCSPAVNAGDDARLPMGISLDFAGNPRQFNTVDIGAFELQSDPFEITAVETDAVSCFGGSDGSITVTASSPFTPLEYSLNGNAFVSTAVFSNLSAGTYSVTVRDANSCQETLTAVEVASPDELLLSVFTTGLTCFEEGDGGIQITASGGTGMYEYSVDGGTTWLQTPNFAGLDAGNYDVAVRDENGCIATQLEILSQPTKLSATLTEEDLSCFDDASGMISITATGGTAPYQYSIDGTNFQNSSDFMNLSAGSYQVEVQDANGCNVTINETLTQPDPLAISLDAVEDASCQGVSDGSITVVGSGGTAPYTYSIDGTSFATEAQFSGLAAGEYTITVRDDNDCTSQLVRVIDNELTISATGTSSEPLCKGDANGIITVAASGGQEPYQYTITGRETFQASPEFSGLVAGVYDFFAIDDNGCRAQGTITLSEPDELSITVVEGARRSYTVSASGGTAPYEFSSDGTSFQSSGQFTALDPGSYSFTVRDNNNCEVSSDLIEAVLSVANTPIRIYPNPTENVISVEGLQYDKLQLISMDGKVIQANKGKEVIDLSELEAGQYVLQLIKGEELIHTQTIIKR